jgi:hypothetical protein
MSAPQICILIRLEDGRPRVTIDALTDSETLRLADWLWSRPELAELVRLAVELQNEERPA